MTFVYFESHCGTEIHCADALSETSVSAVCQCDRGVVGQTPASIRVLQELDFSHEHYEYASLRLGPGRLEF